MTQPLIEITVRLPSRAHKILTRRAKRLGRDRADEAGRLLYYALIRLIEDAERRTMGDALLERLGAERKASDGE